MKRLTDDEQDLVAQSLLNLFNEMPPNVAEEMTPAFMQLVAKLELKPAIGRAAALVQEAALALTAPPAPGDENA